ncbi:MAG: aminodeoxychorismate synthase component I, partial [Campylobacterales bacterium]|nr:aminodeoxychorismate synthase component I [Campylobacterales bacterium]
MVRTLNELGKKGEPFFFLISFDKKNFYASSLKDLDSDISFQLNSFKKREKTALEKFPISFDDYQKKFLDLQEHIIKGNTYLANLCCKSEIKTDRSLEEVYKNSNGKYKLLFKDKFVCFSPETFIKIEDNQIQTFPMKGTINKNVPNGKSKILEDEKELTEHVMVVDLLRNDLSMVSEKVRVEKFRYVEEVADLLQVSSKIVGDLSPKWEESIGDIFDKLLPAGSITGTPKKKCVEILESIEGFDRGFFTGVFGVYENGKLDSGVLIRFIEKENGKLFFKSGCGITESSIANKEYQEMKDKINV